jgi:hypothetical protein
LFTVENFAPTEIVLTFENVRSRQATDAIIGAFFFEKSKRNRQLFPL